MISRISGNLSAVSDSHALVENGGVCYEILVPSALAERLKKNNAVGSSITFETIYYIEAGDKKSSHFPRLVGFTSPVDREFFSLMTQVSGMGVKKALKSLILPISEIAFAIETKDAATLAKLPGVGKRLAEKMIAELNGKTARYALDRGEEPLAVQKPEPSPLRDEALAVLTQLQYTPAEAERMIAKVLKAEPGIDSVELLIELIFRSEQKAKTGK